MRRQQQVWEEIYKQKPLIGSLQDELPSSHVVWFVDFLKGKGITSGNALDIGCGKGRNTLYLAKHGFTTIGIDYIQRALERAREKATAQNIQNASFQQAEIDSLWPFEDNLFVTAIDCFSSIDVETKEGRMVCRDELYRTLKPGGIAFVVVVASDDAIEQETMQKHPGAEKNSTIWPESGKFQKNYDEEELRDFYNMFTLVSLEKIQKQAQKLNQTFTTSLFRLVLQK